MNPRWPEPEQTRKLIEQTLLGGAPRYTRGQVAQRSGVELDRLQQRWRALGFAGTDDDAVLFTDADVEAAELSDRLFRSGMVDSELDASVTRAMGHHLSRLAEWQVQLLWRWLADQPELADDPERAAEVVAGVLPVLERTQNYVWRRHLAAYAARSAGTDDTVSSAHQVVGFVDMVGYTRLTRQIDEARLTSVLATFENVASDVIAQHGGRVVKMIGDEVMFVADAASDAAEIGLNIGEHAAADEELPEMRCGLAHGRVLARLGDVYGPVVNIAARLTSTARPGSVLADEQLASLLQDAPDYDVRSIRPTTVRGYSRLRRFVVRRAE